MRRISPGLAPIGWAARVPPGPTPGWTTAGWTPPGWAAWAPPGPTPAWTTAGRAAPGGEPPIRGPPC